MFEAFFSAFLLLAGFVLVLCLAYWTARLLGSRLDPRQHSRAIELIDRMPVGADRTLCIVRTAGKTLLIGVTPHSIQTLSELDEGRLPPPSGGEESSFAESLRGVLRGRAASEKEGGGAP